MKTKLVPKALVLAAFLVVTLGGCYLPVRFDMEVEVTRGGFYDIIFDGYLARVPLYDGIQKGKIKPEEELKKVAIILTDLKHDTAVKQVSYIRQGHFKVHWEKKGDLLRAKMVTFVRRNEKILELKYVKTTGLITVSGKGIKQGDAKMLAEMGLNVEGQLRVITDARVLQHNAQSVKDRPPGKKMYIWKIKSIFERAPNLVLAPG